MDDQQYFLMCLLKSLTTAGFCIDQQYVMARGSATFATLHPAIPVQIYFEACLDGIRFTIALGSLSFQNSFSYKHLMNFPPVARIVIPEVLRGVFSCLGNQLAANFQNQINS